MSTIDFLIQKLNTSYVACQNDISFCGCFGSTRKAKGHDLDYLIVLKPDINTPTNFKRLKNIVKTFKFFVKKMAKLRKISIIAFPTFRFKIWVLSANPKAVPIHLLIFPSYFHFLSWTKPYPSLREGILTTLQPAFPPDYKEIDESTVPYPATLDWYLGLLYETYILTHCSSLPLYIRRREANDKLSYLMRHLSKESGSIFRRKATPHYTRQEDIEKSFTKVAQILDQTLRLNEKKQT